MPGRTLLRKKSSRQIAQPRPAHLSDCRLVADLVEGAKQRADAGADFAGRAVDVAAGHFEQPFVRVDAVGTSLGVHVLRAQKTRVVRDAGRVVGAVVVLELDVLDEHFQPAPFEADAVHSSAGSVEDRSRRRPRVRRRVIADIRPLNADGVHREHAIARVRINVRIARLGFVCRAKQGRSIGYRVVGAGGEVDRRGLDDARRHQHVEGFLQRRERGAAAAVVGVVAGGRDVERDRGAALRCLERRADRARRIWKCVVERYHCGSFRCAGRVRQGECQRRRALVCRDDCGRVAERIERRQLVRASRCRREARQLRCFLGHSQSRPKL